MKLSPNEIRQLREQRKWSKAELARRANINASTVGQIELGRLVPAEGSVTLKKIAEALGVSQGPERVA